MSFQTCEYSLAPRQRGVSVPADPPCGRVLLYLAGIGVNPSVAMIRTSTNGLVRTVAQMAHSFGYTAVFPHLNNPHPDTGMPVAVPFEQQAARVADLLSTCREVRRMIIVGHSLGAISAAYAAAALEPKFSGRIQLVLIAPPTLGPVEHPLRLREYFLQDPTDSPDEIKLGCIDGSYIHVSPRYLRSMAKASLATSLRSLPARVHVTLIGVTGDRLYPDLGEYLRIENIRVPIQFIPGVSHSFRDPAMLRNLSRILEHVLV